jgi:hypothetical protein
MSRRDRIIAGVTLALVLAFVAVCLANLAASQVPQQSGPFQ